MMELQPQNMTPEARPIAEESTSKPEPITKEVLLLVEGKDEFNFFDALCDHLSLSGQLEIRSFGGRKNLIGSKKKSEKFLTGLCGSSGFQAVKSIGIILDAEKIGEAATFQSVQNSLKKAGLAVPKEAEQLFSCDGNASVGVLILPGQGKPGMLETLLCETFADAPEHHCIDAFFNCVEEKHPSDKARARVFLATKEKPYSSVGVAAAEGYWNLDHKALEPARRFLKSVQPQKMTLKDQPIVEKSSRKPKPKPMPLTKEALLIVEGKDQFKFFKFLCGRLSLSQQLEIRCFSDVSSDVSEFDVFLTGLCGIRGFKDVKSIGIIRDAGTGENAAVEAFRNVQENLKNAKLAVPEKPEQLFSCDGQPSVGVLILPGQGKPGMLETLLCETFADAPEHHCIDAFFRCVKQEYPSDKARVQVFLATRKKLHPSIGIAARKKYWNLDHEVLRPVCRFLQSIAGTAQ